MIAQGQLFGDVPDPKRRRTRAESWELAQERKDLVADKAERVEPGWKTEPLRRVRAYALSHEAFTIEEIGLDIPEDADPRAAGAIATYAKRNGWVKSCGRVSDKWGSWKTQWVSLIFGSR